jgi:predicted enzyme related to lactoylglutathione lyase
MSADPSFIELGVPDPVKAIAFYGALFGWDIAAEPGGGSVSTGTLGIGIHGGDDEAHFEVFFAVPDLEAAISRLGELGGGTVSDVTTSEGFGRWIECRDDQGVRFGLREVAAR